MNDKTHPGSTSMLVLEISIDDHVDSHQRVRMFYNNDANLAMASTVWLIYHG